MLFDILLFAPITMTSIWILKEPSLQSDKILLMNFLSSFQKYAAMMPIINLLKNFNYGEINLSASWNQMMIYYLSSLNRQILLNPNPKPRSLS